jgi:hypothetical protein
VWAIELLSVDRSVPQSITLRCTDATPPHVVRTAVVTQLGV